MSSLTPPAIAVADPAIVVADPSVSSDPTASSPSPHAIPNSTSQTPAAAAVSNYDIRSTKARFSIPTAGETSAAAATAVSIYDIRSTKARFSILIAAAIISSLVPFTDTIYLPALSSVLNSLSGATTDGVAASVSIYMATVGIGSLLWGPIADKFGRRRAILVSLVAYLVFTVACIFSPNIEVLIGLRAAEGVAVACAVSATQAIVADIHPPEERGRAMAIYLMPLLVGPIVAPLVGGALAQAFGWPATFMLLSALGAVLFIVAVVCVPETHHYFVLKRGSGSSGVAPLPPILEADSITKPILHAPWTPLSYMLERPIAPYALVSCAGFAAMFVGLTTFPVSLALPPYGLSSGIIGVLYLPIGVAMMAGSNIGGRLSDWAGKIEPGQASSRLYPSLVGTFFTTLGSLIYGLCLQYETSLVGVIIGHVCLGLGQSLYAPGMMAYFTQVKPTAVAAVGAANFALMFILAAVMISASVPLQAALGTAGLFGLLGGIHLLAVVWATIDLRSRFEFTRSSRRILVEAAAASQKATAIEAKLDAVVAVAV